MGQKVYAAEVRHVSYFDTNVSALLNVYGYYDEQDPTILHQISPRLCDLRIANDSPLRDELAPRVRLAIPAMGISEQSREIPSRRNGVDLVHQLVGMHKAKIAVLNTPTMLEDTVVKTGVSRVMIGASDSVLTKVMNLMGALVGRR